jgi:hypothetical protein
MVVHSCKARAVQVIGQAFTVLAASMAAGEVRVHQAQRLGDHIAINHIILKHVVIKHIVIKHVLISTATGGAPGSNASNFQHQVGNTLSYTMASVGLVGAALQHNVSILKNSPARLQVGH